MKKRQNNCFQNNDSLPLPPNSAFKARKDYWKTELTTSFDTKSSINKLLKVHKISAHQNQIKDKLQLKSAPLTKPKIQLNQNIDCNKICKVKYKSTHNRKTSASSKTSSKQTEEGILNRTEGATNQH